MSNDEPKSSPYAFDIYACPNCDNVITVAVYKLISMDVPCNQCGKRQVSEYELRKGKEGE